MSSITGALEFIKERVDAMLAEVSKQKALANSLAASAGMDPVYADIEVPGATGGAGGAIRPDQFANHSAPSTAARAYLEVRGKGRGAATIDAIYDALVQGGYSFGGAGAGDAKNGLRIALGKDALVHRLPNGHYGLRDWYPNAGIKRDKPKKPGEPEANDAGVVPSKDEPPKSSPTTTEGTPGELF